MRLVYALILCAGFDLHWGWYVGASVVYLAGWAIRAGFHRPEWMHSNN